MIVLQRFGKASELPEGHVRQPPTNLVAVGGRSDESEHHASLKGAAEGGLLAAPFSDA